MVVEVIASIAHPKDSFEVKTIDIDFVNTNSVGQHAFLPREEFNVAKKELEPLLSDSLSLEFIEGKAAKVSDRVGDGISWLFCDGCHCEECVEGEFSAYKDRILPGGWLIFHDCGDEYLGYDPDQFYHGGEEPRPFFVVEFVGRSLELRRNFDFVLFSLPRMRKKKWFGGAYAFRRKTK